MKSLIGYLAAIFLLTVVSSCSKEDLPDEMEEASSSKYYMKFKVDGKQIEYRSVDDENLAGGVTEVPSDGSYLAQVLGDKLPSLPNRNSLFILLSYAENIQVGKIYGTSNSQISGALKSFVAMSYFDDDGSSFITSMSEGFPPPYDAVVRFDDISNNSIKGSFSGTFYQYNGTVVVKKIKITNGEFYVKRI